jgi:signal transduction histidine kinase
MDGMDAFGSGDLSYRVDVAGADEFSAVASRINVMADQLAENQHELSSYSLELERSLASLQKAQQTAVEQEKLAALGGLVAGIAHEVNTPLGVAVTSASLAIDHLHKLQAAAEAGTATRGLVKRFCFDQAEVMEPLASNLSRAAQLISSFKQVAVDRGTVTTRTVCLDQWAQAVSRSLAPTLRKHHVTLRLDLPPLDLQLAAGELEQILSNLVLNACVHAFAPQGDDDASLRVVSVAASADMDRSTLTITVGDRGAGMKPEVAARVFEPFFTTSRGRGGSGLGMHIVHQLIHERFHGHVELQRTLGSGTTWTLTLPMQTEALSLVRRGEPGSVDVTPTATPVPTSTETG